MQEATDEFLENIRKTLYYRGIHGLDSRGRIGIYFTKYLEEAKFYDEKIVKAYLNPTRALVSETSVDLAEMLGLIKEYDELTGAGKYIEADDLLSRKGLKLGYDAFVRRDGDWVIVLKPEIIKEVREASYSINEGELTKFAFKMVTALRGASAGLVSIPQYEAWTKQELEGVADLILEDLREGRTAELEKLYEETSGDPFKEAGKL